MNDFKNFESEEFILHNPKISVVIPLYNRKQYAEDCIFSALNQTFQDFEIVIRDDCSADGVFELVEKNFSSEISSGKIRLLRNSKNIGETATVKKLFEDARGKYITILHNDDLYLPHALQHLYEVAENFQADVVHGTVYLSSIKDGVIKDGTPLRKMFQDFHQVKKVEQMPFDLNFRFNEWETGGTFQDMQYNIYRKDFLFESGVVSEMDGSEHLLFCLLWIMRAKIFVKTPEIFYIRRDNPFSQTNEVGFSEERLEQTIASQIFLFSQADKFISNFDFFKNNSEFNYLIKARIFISREDLEMEFSKIRGNKNYAALYKVTEDIFKKKFGSDGIYFALLYHWGHILQFNKNKAANLLKDCLKILSSDI